VKLERETRLELATPTLARPEDTNYLVDALFGHEKSEEVDEFVVASHRVHIHPILPVHCDAQGTGNLHCSDLRVRGPHSHTYRERSSRRKKRRGIYPGNARIAARSVFERRLRGLKAVGRRVADGELAGFSKWHRTSPDACDPQSPGVHAAK